MQIPGTVHAINNKTSDSRFKLLYKSQCDYEHNRQRPRFRIQKQKRSQEEERSNNIALVFKGRKIYIKKK